MPLTRFEQRSQGVAPTGRAVDLIVCGKREYDTSPLLCLPKIFSRTHRMPKPKFIQVEE